MKKIFLAAIGIVCLMVSCSKDSTTELQTNPMVGQEVQFSPNQDLNLQTRTVYGDKDETNNLYPIYWVNGDKVLVYGSTCAVKQAEYAVSVDVVNQNFADALNKTGAAGVQWGESNTSNFLAIYPSSAATITSDTKATATIRSTQNNVFEPVYSTDGKTIVGWKGHPFASKATEKTMVDGIMYARTEGARSDLDTDEDKTVGEVDLRFKPFTTVLKFKLRGVDVQNNDNATVYVQSITVTSPNGSPIAGEFDLAVSGSGKDATATATAGKTTSNTITLNTILAGGSYIPLTENVPIEFDVFTLPLPNQTISNLWTVKVATNYGEFTYKLTPNTSNTALAAGMVHHITIPLLKVLGTAAWDPTKWMTQVPQDVYLSELSIPGTWYTNDSDYQATTDLATLYNAGIRAFNIDCRISKDENTNDGWFSGTESEWSDNNYTDGNAYLACAGTENWSVGFSGTQYVSNGTFVVDVVKQLCALAQQHLDEYIVIVFTFAESPKVNSSAVFGTVRPDYITEELNTILNTAGIKEYLYTGVTKDTTIQQVLNSGKNVIVKINHSNVDFATSTSPAFSMPEGVMASFASMAKEGYIQTGVTDIVSGLTTSTSPYYAYYSKMQEYPIYNGKTKTDLTYYYHQAQRTSSDETQGVTTYTAVPTLGNRKDAIDDIIEKSTAIYDASTHDAWFQIAIGGSIDGNNPAGVAPLVTYLNEKIAAKMDTDPSPVGIVLMNHATTTGATLVTNIIEMNGKFYLKRAGGDIITDGSGDSSGTTGGDDMGDDQP